MRQLAAVIATIMGLAAAGAWLRSPLGAGALLAAAALTVSTNGLAFTAVAELAGMPWAGRELGVQNTAQNVAAAATPPVTARAIEFLGYPATFGITALFPVAVSRVSRRRGVRCPGGDGSRRGRPLGAAACGP
ncbi:MAG: hypothetical protein JOY82_08785 [Streptosporangiaceae bacterium]|nr:hypothetical protein [Streptosporangiaceae bacterium]MBV9854609.1 hypothetical protein [Streptosporangiaceae bacterium]